MKIQLLRKCCVVAEEGSIVEVSEDQYKVLGDFCRVINDKIETPEESKKAITRSKKK